MNKEKLIDKLNRAQTLVDEVNTELHGNEIVNSPVGDVFIAFDEAFHYVNDYK